MSSWKNAAKSGQKIHKERHQPASRSSLGFLEKKKDYKRRANDHHKKDQIIKALHKKVLNKNPDEFYFHMVNSGLKDGVHHEVKKGEEHTPEQVQLMKTQDLRYVIMKRTMEAKKIEALKAELHMLDEANQTRNTHTFFADSEKEARTIDVAERLGTHPALIGCRVNRLRTCDLEAQVIETLGQKEVKAVEKYKKKKYGELAKRIHREQELSVVQRKLELKKHLAVPSAERPKQIKQATKTSAAVFKWKYERKR